MNELVTFEVLWIPVFLPWLIGYDSVVLAEACIVIWDATGIFPVCLPFMSSEGWWSAVPPAVQFLPASWRHLRKLQDLKWLQAESNQLCSVAAVNNNSCYNSDKMSRDCHWEWWESTSALLHGRRYEDVSHLPCILSKSDVSGSWGVLLVCYEQSPTLKSQSVGHLQKYYKSRPVCQCMWYCLERERLNKAEALWTLWSWTWKERKSQHSYEIFKYQR